MGSLSYCNLVHDHLCPLEITAEQAQEQECTKRALSAHKVWDSSELLSRPGKMGVGGWNQMLTGEMVPWMKVVTIKSENLISNPGSPQGGKREQSPGNCLWISLQVPEQCMYAHVHA